MEPRDVVQAAIDAYHDHDLDRCMGYYAPDVVVKQVDGTIVMDGAEVVRARYAQSMADHPNLHYEIPNRIALGGYVIDEERITGFSPGGPDMRRAALIYRFEGDLIRGTGAHQRGPRGNVAAAPYPPISALRLAPAATLSPGSGAHLSQTIDGHTQGVTT